MKYTLLEMAQEILSDEEEATKQCRLCKEEKPLSLFQKNKKCKNGVTSKCNYCANEYNKTVRDPSYRAPNASINNKKYYQKNREKILEYSRAYRKKNQHKYNHYQKIRHTLKMQATPSKLSESQLKEIEHFYELAKKYEEPMHVDHIIPLQGKGVCGLHVPWNLQIIPALENIRKGNRYEMDAA